MIKRALESAILNSLNTFPVVAIIGARQVGKTTLAHMIIESFYKECVYLDLERDSDRAKLEEAELYLENQKGKLVIVDEVQRRPELFPLLRSLIDERIQEGERFAHFLILGSASRDLLRQSSESLAGRIAYHELSPFSLIEARQLEAVDIEQRLWLRGGFPRSFLPNSESESVEWRDNFISTYLERDIPLLEINFSQEHMRRLWKMLAFSQGETLNFSKLAGSLGVSDNTVRRYVDILTDLYMVRQLRPWSGNVKKRLVKSPKVYVRDSGLLHSLLQISSYDQLLSNPVCGHSWEGFVIEEILRNTAGKVQASFYRSSNQNEIDLVIESPPKTLAIEIKRNVSPKVRRGFVSACKEIKATDRFFIAPVKESFPLAENVIALSLVDALDLLGTEKTRAVV